MIYSNYESLGETISGQTISLNKSTANTWYKIGSITLPKGQWLLISETQYGNLSSAGYIALAIASAGNAPTQLNQPYNYFNSGVWVSIKRTDYVTVAEGTKTVEVYTTCTVTSQSATTHTNIYAVRLK